MHVLDETNLIHIPISLYDSYFNGMSIMNYENLTNYQYRKLKNIKLTEKQIKVVNDLFHDQQIYTNALFKINLDVLTMLNK